MNPKRIVLSAAAALFAMLLTANTYAQFPGGLPPGDSGTAGDKPAPKPRVRWQKPLQLPEQYRSKDKDKDGQIGMYEWDKRDFATFRKLDRNHDGFLTAEELTRGPSSRPGTSVASAKPETSTKGTRSGSAGTATAADSTADSAAVADKGDSAEKPAADGESGAATAAVSTPGRSEAERQWDVIDKDKDGKVTEAEWAKSYLARPKFRDAGIAVTFPLGREEFLQSYSQLPGSGK